MNPALSVVFFTALIGAAQGLVVALALFALSGFETPARYVDLGLVTAEALLIAGLAASFAHLGRPERAWRAVLMWRTSWLSREVIVLPAFIAAVAAWWLMLRWGVQSPVMPIMLLVLAFALWHCTAMIYACLRFIEEWAHPLTRINFILVGLSSGLLLASSIGALMHASDTLHITGVSAFGVTLVAGMTRLLALRRNAVLRPRSTLQSATGIRATPLRQISMGMSAGSFNTREFFHGVGAVALRNIKATGLLSGFLIPLALIGLALASDMPMLYVAALLAHLPGLVADRWFFFAQARHPQNLYYQVVS